MQQVFSCAVLVSESAQTFKSFRRNLITFGAGKQEWLTNQSSPSTPVRSHPRFAYRLVSELGHLAVQMRRLVSATRHLPGLRQRHELGHLRGRLVGRPAGRLCCRLDVRWACRGASSSQPRHEVRGGRGGSKAETATVGGLGGQGLGRSNDRNPGTNWIFLRPGCFWLIKLSWYFTYVNKSLLKASWWKLISSWHVRCPMAYYTSWKASGRIHPEFIVLRIS